MFNEGDKVIAIYNDTPVDDLYKKEALASVVDSQSFENIMLVQFYAGTYTGGGLWWVEKEKFSKIYS